MGVKETAVSVSAVEWCPQTTLRQEPTASVRAEEVRFPLQILAFPRILATCQRLQRSNTPAPRPESGQISSCGRFRTNAVDSSVLRPGRWA